MTAKSKFKRKAMIPIFACIIVATSVFPACEKHEVATSEEMIISEETALREYKEILTIPRTGKSYPEEINRYIERRVDEMGYSAETDTSGNIIVDIPPALGAEDLPLVILQCRTDDAIESSRGLLFDAESDGVSPDLYRDDGTIRANGVSMGASGAVGIATALCVMDADQWHGSLRVIFTSGVNGDMSGAKRLNPDYLNGQVLINLNGTKLGEVGIGAPFAATFSGERELQSSDTQGRRAHVLAASGFPKNRMLTDEDEPQINPAEILAEILMTAKSGGIIYDLCNFSGGTDALRIPSEATAIIVLNDYEERKFLQIFESAAKEYRNDVGDGVNIEMIETVVPEKCVSNDDASNVLTFLFGLLSADFSTDKGDKAGDLFINRADLSPDHFTCEISVAGIDEDTVNRIIAEQSNIEKLSGIPIEETRRIPGFSTSEDSENLQYLLKSYEKILGDECRLKKRSDVDELGYLREKNPEQDIMSVGITIEGKDTIGESIDRDALAIPANAILEYLTSSHKR
ncbi:MAG: hypothetical protein LBH63_02315 [Clostridiales Family XIII bacterium]|jgi:dipeptidase D|nr:hypothetical protein [Clostridiales Family XIII bacterium]